MAFGLVVAAREVLYLATTLGGAVACPAYLLLDLATTWHEAASTRQGGFRVAMYVLTPHNYVALALAARFSAVGSLASPRHRRLVWLLGAAALGLGAACVASSLPAALAVKLEAAALLCLAALCFVVSLRHAQRRRRTAEDGGIGIELAELSAALPTPDGVTERPAAADGGGRGALSHAFLGLALMQVLHLHAGLRAFTPHAL
jgi:peptidoglycan/LPS O-acetylase OafA/YrhL